MSEWAYLFDRSNAQNGNRKTSSNRFGDLIHHSTKTLASIILPKAYFCINSVLPEWRNLFTNVGAA
jgi:hypothetical protein